MTVRSVEKAFAVLEAVVAERDGLTAQQVSERLNLPYATAHRMLTTLHKLGYLHFQESHKVYRIGPQVLKLYTPATHQEGLGRLAYPLLAKLSEETNETVHLAVQYGQEVLYLDTVLPAGSYSMYTPVGTRSPLHSTALGKALLAFRPDSEIKAVLKNYTFRPLTPATILTEEAMYEAIEETRRNGYAVDREESTIGVRCVASVIVNSLGYPEAAVSVSTKGDRLKDEEAVRQIGALVCAATRAISHELGFPLGPDPASWYEQVIRHRGHG